MITNTIEYLIENKMYKNSKAVEIAKGSCYMGNWRRKLIRWFKNI
jgi:hypothetical protein